MKEECLICKAPLEYLEVDELMECAICHKKENSKTRCVEGHYVCNDCHTAGLDSIIGLCLNETSKNPIYIIKQMMALPFCHMHGPEHHVMVGSALLTAYKNAGGQIDLQQALSEMMNRGKSVPGGACGRHQFRYVRIYHLQIHTIDKGTFCTVSQDDGKITWRNRQYWWATLL